MTKTVLLEHFQNVLCLEENNLVKFSVKPLFNLFRQGLQCQSFGIVSKFFKRLSDFSVLPQAVFSLLSSRHNANNVTDKRDKLVLQIINNVGY